MTNPAVHQADHQRSVLYPAHLTEQRRLADGTQDRNGAVKPDTSASDAIGSVANLLAVHGWEPGGPVSVPVRPEADF